MNSVIEAVNLRAGYGDLAAVRDLNIKVEPGEMVALLGANGAGKTTTLLTLAGWIKPLSGEVFWKGQPTTAPLVKRARDGLAFVPEERSVIMSLSVAANLRLGSGDPDRALSVFPPLRPLLGRRAGLLSGGEQQMLTVGRALAANPALLMADELSLGLAPLTVQALLRALRDATEDGVGVLVVEQRTKAVLDVCDRAYVLSRGSVVMEGTAAQLKERFDEVQASYIKSSGDAEMSAR